MSIIVDMTDLKSSVPPPVEAVRGLYINPKIPPPKPVRIIPQGAPVLETKAPSKKVGRPRRFNYPY